MELTRLYSPAVQGPHLYGFGFSMAGDSPFVLKYQYCFIYINNFRNHSFISFTNNFMSADFGIHFLLFKRGVYRETVPRAEFEIYLF